MSGRRRHDHTEKAGTNIHMKKAQPGRKGRNDQLERATTIRTDEEGTISPKKHAQLQ